MKKTILISVLLSLTLFGCKGPDDGVGGGTGGPAANPSSENPAADESINPDDEIVDGEEDESGSHVKTYVFNHLEGKCADSEGLEGLNPDQFGECGDLSNQNLSNLDFTKKNYWKLNLEDSVISDSKVKIGKIAQYEVDYNEQTIFEGVKNFFTKLFNQHVHKMESQQKKMDKSNTKVSEIKAELEQLMVQYAQEDNDKKRAKLENKITKVKGKLEKHKAKVQYAMNKMYRHQTHSKKAYDLASGEPKMENPKIKNKSWLTLTSKSDSIQIESASNTLSNDNFAVSFWFRATEKQNGEGRIINFLHSGNHSSLIFGVHNQSVFFGYRDHTKKYKRTDFKFDYATSEWQHVVISYESNQFRVYLNEDLLANISDTYFGFGEAPATLGSYKLSNHVFVGDIDEVSTWTKALTAEDVKELYNSGSMTNLQLHPQHFDLAKWWRLGDKNSRQVAGEVIE